ncbi:hypothetical protein [Solibacillus sp. CAU 1738]|uniref:hypothetical protein n=1 Tax=Solibacillus sp. CAU 1738 TaxID=3140363 RepID=UPI00325FF3F9
MFFQTKKIAVQLDLYEKLKTIVTFLLRAELPDASATHHILYSANVKLQKLQEAKDFHYKERNVDCAIGRFHKIANDNALKQYNQLQIIVDSYVALSLEEEREHFNHRLRFQSEVVIYCYNQLMTTVQILDASNKQLFFAALKEDILPVLHELTQ